MKRQPEITIADEMKLLRKAERARAEYIGAAFRRAFARVAEAIRRRRESRRQLAQLEALDERTLHDLGISRGEIMYAFRHGRDIDQPANQNERGNEDSRVVA